MSDPGSFLKTARERHLFRYIVFYAGAAWVVAQVIEFFLDNYGGSQRVLDIALFLLAVGFFVTAVFAWYHGEKGHQRVQRSEAGVLGVLAVLGAVGVGWLAVRDTGPDFGSGIDPSVDLGPNSVAVLPFRNEIESAEFGWLDRGVAELLATDLSQLDTLRVVSGQRIFDLLRQFGVEEGEVVPDELHTRVTQRAGARYLLTGSVLGAPGNVQVVARLSDARSGVTRASARARGADVFRLIDEVSASLSADLLGRELGPDESVPVARLTTRSLDAFREYEQGRVARFRFHLQDAREHFERAVTLDSTFALAHFQLAGLMFQQGDMGNAVEHLQAADRHLDVASERDRLYVSGFVDLIQGRREEGLRKLRELIAKYPDEKDARVVMWAFLRQQPGTEEETERLIRETVELDPYYAPGWNVLAYQEAQRGNFTAADSLIRRYVELEPGEPNPIDSQGEIAEMAGRYEDAREAYRGALEIREDFYLSLHHLVRTYLREGRPAAARGELASWRASESADTRARAWLLTGDTRMWEGDVSGAIATYDSAIAVAASTGRRDLHGLALGQMVRTLLLLERYPDAVAYADSLVALRGHDALTATTRLHALADAGHFEEAEKVREQALDYFGDTPGLQAFARQARAGMDMILAFHREEYGRVLELLAELRNPNVPAVQFGYPGIRAALALGDAAAARAGTEGLVAATALEAPDRLPPLETRIREYFRGRIAELEADTAAARAAYDRLLEEWGDALPLVPPLRDVETRREALGGPSE